MFKKLIYAALLSLISISLLTSIGCSNSEKINFDNVNKEIKIEVIDISKSQQGTTYKLKLINSSKYVIKQNSIFLSYPIKLNNGLSTNKCKVEATGNKLDIKPSESVILTAFMQIENYKNTEFLDIEHPELEIEAYIGEVNILNHFTKIGGLDLFQ